MEKNDTYWNDLIGKQLSGNTSPEEERCLELWKNESQANMEMYLDFKQIWDEAKPPVTASTLNMEKGWNNILKTIQPDQKIYKVPEVSVRYNYRTFRIWASAAAVLLLIVSVFLFKNPTPSDMSTAIVIQSDSLKSEKIVLPDGSIVWMNKNSKIEYESTRQTRMVRLSGEAYFDVQSHPEKPFQVHALQSVVEVVGTEFNIYTNESEQTVELLVTEGVVSFRDKRIKDQKMTLKASQAAQISKEQPIPILVSPQKVRNVLSWKTKQLTFDHAPVSQVIEDLERHYDIDMEVVNPAILDCTYMATFENIQLKELLEALQFSLPLQINRINGKYLISGESCAKNK